MCFRGRAQWFPSHAESTQKDGGGGGEEERGGEQEREKNREGRKDLEPEMCSSTRWDQNRILFFLFPLNCLV